MKRHISFLVIAALATFTLFTPPPLSAQNHETATNGKNWTAENTVLAITSTSLIIADWGQALYGLRHQADGFYERNPLLGLYPSLGKIHAYFATAMVVNLGVGRLLPNPWRNVVFMLVTAAEGYVVTKNFALGESISF